MIRVTERISPRRHPRDRVVYAIEGQPKWPQESCAYKGPGRFLKGLEWVSANPFQCDNCATLLHIDTPARHTGIRTDTFRGARSRGQGVRGAVLGRIASAVAVRMRKPR